MKCELCPCWGGGEVGGEGRNVKCELCPCRGGEGGWG